ncbi:MULTISPECIES: hypothetical protein [Photorhabdus]|uniref:Uncharacterized protein n=2 Tax=Photorhabdus TaxID=29487 RepID=A0AAW6BJM1_9GAMM|nr:MULTISPECIES: hypothetical protein [Photorhabdus]EYU16551.1 hypothetical protein BA1DRAFT_00835 [Photorhabdus aegyptia]MDB6373844.1 hypothetical protein [Photorhabdus bodei]
MQVRATINRLLFPELVEYLESFPSGQRSSALVALANRAYFGGSSRIATPQPKRATCKLKRSKGKTHKTADPGNSAATNTQLQKLSTNEDSEELNEMLRQKDEADVVESNIQAQPVNKVVSKGSIESSNQCGTD